MVYFFQPRILINYIKFCPSKYTESISTRLYRGLHDLYDDLDREEQEEMAVTEFEPELNATIRDIHFEEYLIVQGILVGMHMTYMVEAVPGMVKSDVEGVIHGPDVLHGYEDGAVPVLMCLTEQESAISWTLNGTNLNLRLCTISIARPKMSGPGLYKCIVNGQCVGCISVDSKYNMSPITVPDKKKIDVKVSVEKTDSTLTDVVSSTTSTASNMLPVQNYTIIDKSQIEMGEYLSEGGGGTVFKVRYLGREYAGKRIMHTRKNCKKVQEEIDAELQVHALLRCDGIVQLIGRYDTTNATFIITELVDGPDLDSFLFGEEEDQDFSYDSLSEAQRAKMAFDMCSAVSYIHESQSTPIIHRDLKPGNFVVRKNDLAVKLIDLGIAKIRQLQTMGKTVCVSSIAGTWTYCAPEKMMSSVDGTISIDIWGLGCCLVELMTRREIWNIPDDASEIDFLVEKMLKEEEPHGLTSLKKSNSSKQVIKIISRALSYNPTKRPSAQEMAKVFKDLM